MTTKTTRKKTLTFGELAMSYFPSLSERQARRKLREWIALNSELSERLGQMGFTMRHTYLTPRMTLAIYELLGEP